MLSCNVEIVDQALEWEEGYNIYVGTRVPKEG